MQLLVSSGFRCFLFFISVRVFFTDTDDSQDSKGREGAIFYSTLPLAPAHEHWHIYLQLCMWDGYHVFLIATLVFTRLLLDEIYHLIELPFAWLIGRAIFVSLHWKPVDLNSHRLSPLYYKRTDQPSVLVTPRCMFVSFNLFLIIHLCTFIIVKPWT